MTLGNMREVGVLAVDRVVPQRRLPASGADRRVELPAGGAVLRSPSGLREVRRQTRRRAAKLERAATEREPNGQAMGLADVFS